MQSVTRISQSGTKSVFSQSGNSREVTPILVAQTQSSGPQTRYEINYLHVASVADII